MSDVGPAAGPPGTRVPPAWRVASVIFAVHVVWLTWLEVEVLRSPEWTLRHLVPRALWIVVLVVLARGLWRGSRRARTWAIGLLITMLACYVIFASAARHFDPETWDAAAWFGGTALLFKAWNLASLALLLWPSGRRAAAPP